MQGRFGIHALGWLLGGAALLSASGGSGCVEIEGGAVEVAWVLRDTRQRSAPCDAEGLKILEIERIDRVRLQIRRISPDGGVSEDLCAAGVVTGCEWSCSNRGGTTPFNIPVPDANPDDGEDSETRDYVFNLVPLSVDGTPIDPSIVAVPSPVRRTVARGDLADLGLWMIVVPAKEDVDEDPDN